MQLYYSNSQEIRSHSISTYTSKGGGRVICCYAYRRGSKNRLFFAYVLIERRLTRFNDEVSTYRGSITSCITTMKIHMTKTHNVLDLNTKSFML